MLSPITELTMYKAAKVSLQ